MIARTPGWFGVRPWRGASYFVVRDVRRHPPLFSERYGYRPFTRLLRVGAWEVGFFAR